MRKAAQAAIIGHRCLSANKEWKDNPKPGCPLLI
jgi:hypothetical protein